MLCLLLIGFGGAVVNAEHIQHASLLATKCRLISQQEYPRVIVCVVPLSPYLLFSKAMNQRGLAHPYVNAILHTSLRIYVFANAHTDLTMQNLRGLHSPMQN